MLYGDEEDRRLVVRSILYPIVFTIFTRDLTVLQQAPLKLHRPYVHLLEHAMGRMTRQLRDVRKEMKRRQITVTSGETSGDVTRYSIFIRGYEEEMRFPNAHLRNLAEQLMHHVLLQKL
ncbi:hypothetical protein A374_14420 [Fictibacillus macauensis ZFHKF-1]|uniref:Uncharacterized protein n=1 Tax=Fictibacillus macauensis ZFHKF-1 TaxID=1196324 RepID=I8AFY5_9BACL|nr:hypothetical protein [Fictibacillus macauensis]EIT84532.1 hypothetical protein A374_14420 [Fictibacillus macauensis ZFHKF-1]